MHVDEILDIESRGQVDHLVLVRAHASHAPWITAHAEHLAGEAIEPVGEASTAIKAMVEGISLLPVLNQGLSDSRERTMAVQALTFMHTRGHKLVPAQLVVEAIRNNWPRLSPLELCRSGTQYQPRQAATVPEATATGSPRGMGKSVTATPHFPRIPGFELSDAAPTLATEWPRPAGDYPDALWPVTSLRRVTPEPTGWLIVEEHFHRDDMYGGTHSVLARPGAQDRVFRSTAWSGHHSIGDIELWNDGRFTDGLTNGDDPAAPDLRFFSQVREHHRLLIPTFEVTPPFMWYWDAFPSSDGWSYLNAAGRDVELIRTVISIDEWRIEVSALELRTFLADAGLELLVQMDYTTTIDHDAFPRVDHAFRSDGAHFDWFAMHDRSTTGRGAFSNVMGKYLIRGAKTARRRRGEERRDLKNHLEFIYAVDPSDGSTLTHTCDPTQLGSYRDNSRLHELTPVYFSREVLSRYANEPGRYHVTGGRISCLDLWSLDISTNSVDLVEVYLCELGSLPAQEQSHWLAYNVAPEGKMEEGRFRRDFLNQIAASPDPVRDLHRARAAAMESTRALLGTPLWKELDPQTRGEFDRLVGPTTTDPSALGPPILTLTKAMVDGIEPAPLKEFLGDAQKDEKSLALLGRFLERLGDTNDSIEPFKALQMFRSAGGVAHLGGSKAPAARDRLGIEDLAPWPAFVEVVQRLTIGLERINALVAAANSEL